MGKTRDLGFLRNIFVMNDTSVTNYVPTARSLTINGTTLDLSADRTFNIATSATLGGLTDATISTLVDNQLLRYNAATSKWVNWTPNYLTGITSSQVTTALGYTPVTNARTITINGTSYDLSADRSWTIAGGVTSFNSRSGAVTLSSSDVTSALGYTPYNSSNPSGYLSGTVAIGNGGTGATSRKAASSNIANFGQLEDHGTYADFNSVQQWGGTYVQSTTNGPGVNGAGQYYQMMLSLGANYDWGSSNVYACQIAIPRNVSTPYIAIRYKEGGGSIAGWNGWQKISAGYADSAGTITSGATTQGYLYTPNGSSFIANGYNNNGGFAMNNASTYWGLMWNYAANDWRLGYGSQISQNGWNLRWDNGSTVWVNGELISGGNHVINNSSPTIYLRDTDHRSSMIHCNSNIFYILRGNGTNTTSWATYNGYWPLEFNLENNNATFGGNITAVYDITAYSDVRVKKNISTIDNALDKVLALRGVTYQRTDMPENGEKYHVGVIAQEVEKIVPEVVALDHKGHLNVAYGNMSGLFIEAFKEHDRTIKQQAEEINRLKEIINGLTK